MRRFSFTFAYTMLFALLALVNRFDRRLSLPPASIHQWRQADGASIARHYAEDLRFGEVRISNLQGAGDAHACGEFPGLYWLAGLAERCCGAWWHYPLRWIGLLLLFAGGWCFGRMLLRRSGDVGVAALGAGLLLSAPILVYYGPNTLPDAPAVCLLAVMAAGLDRADRAGLVTAALAGALAILLKISMAILPAALFGAWLLARRKKAWPPDSLWSRPAIAWMAAGVVAIVLAFQIWMRQYNAAHQSAYFLASTRPIWQYDGAFILETFRQMTRQVLPAFASVGLYLAAAAGAWLLVKNRNTRNMAQKTALLLLLFGSAMYFLLWFRMFREHDYYAVCLLPVPAYFVLEGLPSAQKRYGTRKVAIFLAICWVLALCHDYYLMDKRLRLALEPDSTLSLPPEAFLSAQDLAVSGIPADARFVCPQDPSPNIALYALRREGWTNYNFHDRITADTLLKYQTRFGLTHLALRDSTLYDSLYARFFPVPVLRHKGWWIFRKEN